ncbi:heparinase II/III-family protein [Synechococcus sp. CS-1333]|uniref:heparinase II/III-family protein n=1 Tax=Synechococcus sp. CS-1333 TaxID=2848638 RepID=UPI00223ADB01|nr:heparinase II/III-family protein [Synechococcus sp. CS-1333]
MALPSSQALLPAWGDARWQAAAHTPYGHALVAELKALEVADCRAPLPLLTAELYSQVHRSGERLPFERVWQERRRRLARAAVRLLLDPEATVNPGGTWWGQLLAAIQELLAEPSWAWPAHVRDPSGIDAGVIDLFAAETANLCGELVSLFGHWLPPAWVAQMRERVLAEMVGSFLAKPEASFWTTQASNWNAVCHQGLLGAALALAPEAPWLQELVDASQRNLQVFLEGFSAEGSCLEGITYWEYGFGWFALLNEQLERWSDGEQSLVSGQDDRTRAIACFGPAMLLRGGQMVNVADSRLGMPPRASLLMLLGRRLDLAECTQAGVRLYQQALNGRFDVQHQRCDLFYLTRMLLEAPSADVQATATEPACGDWIDSDAGLVVVRRLDSQGCCWELAVKGGHNDEPHNHNDCGSFLLNVDGERLAIELGAPEYTADTFGPKRYTLLATRSSGHSVPIVNGHEQAAGRAYAAQLLAVETGASLVRVQLDLTRAYPTAAGHQRLLRTIVLDCAAGCLKVEDALWGNAGIELESVLITDSDDPEALGIEPLASSALQRKECVRFRDNRGEEVSAYRWYWTPSTAEPSTEADKPLLAGYRISPKLKHGVDVGVANGIEQTTL